MKRAIALLFLLGVAFSSSIVVSTQTDFDLGTYINTAYNTSSGAVELVGGNTSGAYISKIFDIANVSSWLWLNWTNNYGVLPDNNKVESNANMSDNIILLHINETPGATNFSDSSGNGNNFSCSPGNCPTITSGGMGFLDGTIAEFDGSSSYMISDSSLVLPAPFTIMAWAYFNNLNQPTGDYDYVFSISEGGSGETFAIARYAGGNANANRLYIYIDGAIRYGPVLPGREWLHLTLAVDPVSPYLRVYVNGEEVSLDSYPSSIGSATGNLYVGRYFNPVYRHYLNGKVDELAVFNRSLSAAEIKAIYERQRSKFNVSARACSDPTCSSTSWVDIKDTSPVNISGFSNTSYFQVMFNFTSFNSSFTPQLFNFSIDYSPLSSGGGGGSGGGSSGGDSGGGKSSMKLEVSFNCEDGLIVFTGKTSTKPLSNARITAKKSDLSWIDVKYSNSDGYATFNPPTSGEYLIRATKSGYISEEDRINIDLDECKEPVVDEPEIINVTFITNETPKEEKQNNTLLEDLLKRIKELERDLDKANQEISLLRDILGRNNKTEEILSKEEALNSKVKRVLDAYEEQQRKLKLLEVILAVLSVLVGLLLIVRFLAFLSGALEKKKKGKKVAAKKKHK